MERQIFINEMQARFNLRKPRSEKPTNLYLVCRINNKQVKLSTGVKIYPGHWNEKRQEAYISVRLSELDNINNTIVNKKITKLKEYFIEFKHYLCMHPDEIGESMKLLKQHIYKDKMKKELQKPVTFIMKQIIEAKTCAESYNPQIQISAESETKRSIFREKDKTKRSKKESAQHSKSRNKSFVMTSVSAL